tara:strand:+ start:128 stop:532 length:405 start_codon:yes stop_codon:yes gene_type:complete
MKLKTILESNFSFANDPDAASDAAQDDYMDQYYEFIRSDVIPRRYVSVYDLLDHMGADEQVWDSLSSNLGDVEKLFVRKNDVDEFKAALARGSSDIQSLISSLNDIVDDEDNREDFDSSNDISSNPDAFFNAPR